MDAQNEGALKIGEKVLLRLRDSLLAEVVATQKKIASLDAAIAVLRGQRGEQPAPALAAHEDQHPAEARPRKRRGTQKEAIEGIIRNAAPREVHISEIIRKLPGVLGIPDDKPIAIKSIDNQIRDLRNAGSPIVSLGKRRFKWTGTSVGDAEEPRTNAA